MIDGGMRVWKWLSNIILYCCVCMAFFAHTFAYPGCNDPVANNYDSNATSNNDSCVYCGVAQLFDPPGACCDDLDASGVCDYDEICVYPVAHGCTDPAACNYAPDAVVDVGNCVVCGPGHACNPNNRSCCEDPDNNNICGDQGAGGDGGGGGDGGNPDPVGGCLTASACNYTPNADYDNGSCIFPAGCNDWCPGDPGSIAYLDACGVCDSNLNNDNTTCAPDEESCPYPVGQACDDGDTNTGGDAWNENCLCIGAVTLCPAGTDRAGDPPTTPGSSCDDGDPNTDDDVWGPLGCNCSGEIAVCSAGTDRAGSPPATPGAFCNDGNPDTIDDARDATGCSCEGTFVGLDCEGVAGGNATPGSSCNDNNPNTSNDIWNASCVCEGQPTQPLDCQGIPGGTAVPGSTCNDGNPATQNDTWSASCVCEGDIVPGVDCQGVPGGDALPGNSCNDGNPDTIDDTWNNACTCVGVSQPLDCQGVLGGDAIPGSSCNDGDPDTSGDTWTDACSCIGQEDDEEQEHPVADDDSIFSYPTVPGALYLDMQNPLVREEFQDIIDEYGIDDIYQPFENLDLDIYRIDFDPSIPHEDLIAALQERFGDSIDFAEPIPLIQLNIKLSQAQTLDKQILPAYLAAIGYDRLIQQCSYLFGAQKKKVRVAVIDNGFQSHEDLDAHVVYTYDTADRDDNVYITDTRETCAHGNVDAGLVGAVSTNDLGIISAGYNPELVLIKATPDGRPCTDITAGIEGLAKAADYAHIINVSWGVSFDSKVLKRVVEKITERGIVIVAAAGNFSTNTPFYPAAYEQVIAVGAVDANNQQAHFSNYGSRVDIAAPGVDMLSTGLENEYIKVSGTSQSAPLVAGWLAFLLSQGVTVDDLFTHITPIDEKDLGVGVINAASYCADTCIMDYSSLDYTDDGMVDSADARFLKNWIADEFITLGCSEQFSSETCCPVGKICDMDDSARFDSTDLTILQDIIDGTFYHEILADGIDNDCDGIVDDAEHGVAPVATTASWYSNNTYFLLIVLLLLLGYLGWYVRGKRAYILQK